jgi:mannose-1-phosphate guanylyltransferase
MSELRMLAAKPSCEENNTSGQETRLDYTPLGAADSRWAVILSGGDGKRLLPLTRKFSGDDRPKQSCKLPGSDSLLVQTLRRIARVASPQRTFSVVTRSDERFFRHEAPEALLIQPCNLGTGPAITYSLEHIQKVDPDAVVGFFPSDHHFSDERVLVDCVNRAYKFAELHPDTVVLLGIKATHPETGYGWIEPSEPLQAIERGMIFAVRGFWEKPSQATAVALMRRGCLWNSFIMVGRLEAFREFLQRAVPYLLHSFDSIAPALFTPREESRVADLYRGISSSSFAKDVLSTHSGRLAVVFNKALEWVDVGEVDRALSLIEERGLERGEVVSIARATA